MTPKTDLSGIGPLWLVGGGNMGGALLGRWVAHGLGDVTVIDPGLPTLPKGLVPVPALPTTGSPAIVVLAVKPQLWREAAAGLADRLTPGALVLSVMAGIATAALAAEFPGAAIVRAMPNTPARVGSGITALFATAPGEACGRAEQLMRAAGDVVWLDREADFDAVTAVSGSGPAYVFAFVEALAAAAIAAGLTPALAERLARATVVGAGALAGASGAPAAVLREAVTSPGGTTAAGLTVLQAELGQVLCATVAAAQSRSRALGEMT